MCINLVIDSFIRKSCYNKLYEISSIDLSINLRYSINLKIFIILFTSINQI